MLSFIEECPKIVRALNYPIGVPGKGYYELQLHDGRKIIIMQIMLRLFMGLSLDDPFSVTKNFLQKEKLGSTCNAIIVDMHGETTSEKNAYGHFFDGKVSAILGTHTHIPTADAKILDEGTAYQTDVGMTGDYNSVIGMDKANPIHSFVKGYRSEGRFFPAEGDVTVCGAYIETNDKTGLSIKIEPFQI
jgi:metallophosphoesterase (TIGR00282 family)